ncbi:hypothetical protein [Cellvibrio fibrivorans]|uniref:TIGR01906 family membrane protein n=1 Tax=Cellvibrio fibrivorans TaxID=126350 RepID=A0ABU1UUP7_9GAMM|nr:hypothetical protein [Cellvibrio fibrivorans]MDR7088919.1 hypothetical protein [Cellvibrio fibrivorans]
MFNTLTHFATRLAQSLTPLQWWCIAIVLVVIRQLTQVWLDGLYVDSQFPVPFYIGQTTFNAEELKGYYAVLISKGTLEDYFWVQMADYLFMVTVFVSFFALMTAVYRSLPNVKWLKDLACVMVFIAPTAALFDAVENLVSFFFIADAQGFADWLVYPYSSFAVIKFAIFILAYLWAIVGLLISVIGFLVRRFQS